MTRKIINKLSLALFALLLFPSCDNEEYAPEENTVNNGSEKIHFNVVVAAATTISSEGQTRVATSTDGNYTTAWNTGDAIGVYVVKGSGGLESSGNWVDNMQMIYNNGSWTYIFPSGKEYYPLDGDKLSFYAYYPYNPAVTDALNINISGLTDQSTSANLSKSDLLFASTLNVEKGNTAVQLNFSHALTMVEVAVTSGIGAQVANNMVVTLEGCKPDVSFNLSTRAANAAGSVKSVKMYRVEQSTDADYLTKYTYRAQVPTQTVYAGVQLFSFSQKQGDITRALSHTLLSNVALYAGQVKPYDITLLPSIDPNHVYTVGDYYPYKGFPILGIVFETSNGGKNGKIVSLDFLQRYNVAWGDPNVDEQAAGVTGIRDVNDGQTATRNLINKRKDQPNFANVYKLFNWIYQTKNKGNTSGIWYLPAVNEMKEIYNNHSVLFSKISNTGNVAPPSDRWYYTLTEKNASEAYLISFNIGGSLQSLSKDEETWSECVIAIAKF
ncbi:MAG: fimbrillin family protein [Dysgonomonas sp.]